MIASPATDIYMIMESGMVHALPFHTARMLTTLCQAAAGIACALANLAWSASGLAHAVKVTGASHILARPSAMLLVLETLQSMGRGQALSHRHRLGQRDTCRVQVRWMGWARRARQHAGGERPGTL